MLYGFKFKQNKNISYIYLNIFNFKFIDLFEKYFDLKNKKIVFTVWILFLAGFLLSKNDWYQNWNPMSNYFILLYRCQDWTFLIQILGCSLRIYFFTGKLYRSAQDLYKKCWTPTPIRFCTGNETWEVLLPFS